MIYLSFVLSFRNTCLSGTALSLKNLRVRLGNQRCSRKGCILMRLKKENGVIQWWTEV